MVGNPTKSILQAAGADLCALITGAAESWISEQKTFQPVILDGIDVTDLPGVASPTDGALSAE